MTFEAVSLRGGGLFLFVRDGNLGELRYAPSISFHGFGDRAGKDDEDGKCHWAQSIADAVLRLMPFRLNANKDQVISVRLRKRAGSVVPGSGSINEKRLQDVECGAVEREEGDML